MEEEEEKEKEKAMVRSAPDGSDNHTKRFPSCPFVVGIVSASDRTI